MPAEQEIGDYEIGIHSNIPECCVRFYVANKSRVRAINLRRGGWCDEAVQYVMCTRCLRQYRSGRLVPNVVHQCLDSRDSPICHHYLSGPDRVAGVPLKKRYRHYSVEYPLTNSAPIPSPTREDHNP